MKTVRQFPLSEIFQQAHVAKLVVTFKQFAHAPMRALESSGLDRTIHRSRWGGSYDPESVPMG